MIYVTNAFSLNMLRCASALVAITKVDIETVKSLIVNGFVSAVGHEDVAKIVSNLLGIDVPFNRVNVTLNEGDVVVVAQYVGPRLEPGTTTLPSGAKIEFFVVEVKEAKA